MWVNGEKSIYELRELSKTKYKFKGYFGAEKKCATKLEAIMTKYTDKNGNRI